MALLERRSKWTTFPMMHRRGASCRQRAVSVGGERERERERESSVQHLWSSGAERRTETRSPHQQNEADLAQRLPSNWMFKDWTSSPAVDFILSMRYAERLYRPVVTQKNTRWRSSSTEWDSSPTKQWAGKSWHYGERCAGCRGWLR